MAVIEVDVLMLERRRDELLKELEHIDYILEDRYRPLAQNSEFEILAAGFKEGTNTVFHAAASRAKSGGPVAPAPGAELLGSPVERPLVKVERKNRTFYRKPPKRKLQNIQLSPSRVGAAKRVSTKRFVYPAESEIDVKTDEAIGYNKIPDWKIAEWIREYYGPEAKRETLSYDEKKRLYITCVHYYVPG